MGVEREREGSGRARPSQCEPGDEGRTVGASS